MWGNKLHKGEGVMNKRHVFYVGLVLLAALVLFGAPMAAMAAHTGGDVKLKQANGADVTSTTPYSTKQSCGLTGLCHTEGTPAVGGHDYGSGNKVVTKTQGVMEANGQIYWQAYTVKSYEHGISIGRHSNQGRNEEFTNAARKTVNDPFFTSSFGMFGKL
jgi:hypothetical protein